MSGTASAPLRSELLDGGRLARLVIDAGRGNVLDRAAIAALRECVAALAEGPRPAALILDHAGPDFSFGASVADHAPGVVERMLPEMHAAARELLALELPLLAAVRGRCLGGGLELALLADRLVVAPDARLGQPEVQLAVFAPIGSALLPRRIGARATELLVSGRSVDAQEALALGLAAEIAPDPGAAALAWAREHLAPKSTAALRFATAAARRPWLEGFFADLDALERLYLDELMNTRDAREGIRAFLERRPPVWEDR